MDSLQAVVVSRHLIVVLKCLSGLQHVTKCNFAVKKQSRVCVYLYIATSIPEVEYGVH